MNTYRMILIDPEARAVLAIESNGTFQHAKQLVQADSLDGHALNSQWDLLLCAAESKLAAMPFKIGADTIIRGRALVVGGQGGAQYGAPKISIETVRAQVKFSPPCFPPK